jgi:hypothetical protein
MTNKIWRGVFIALGVTAILVSLPDIQRYIRISTM